MRPILCVIDLTETSVKALEVAAKLAYVQKTSLTILFPYRLIDYGYRCEVSNLKTKLEDEAIENFFRLKKRVVLLNQLLYDFKPEIGFAGNVISSHVKRNKVDMVVISQRQANSINEVNNIALQNLIANSKLPFTIIPDDIDTEIPESNQLSTFHTAA
jgi:hypothetical protein